MLLPGLDLTAVLRRVHSLMFLKEAVEVTFIRKAKLGNYFIDAHIAMPKTGFYQFQFIIGNVLLQRFSGVLSEIHAQVDMLAYHRLHDHLNERLISLITKNTTGLVAGVVEDIFHPLYPFISVPVFFLHCSCNPGSIDSLSGPGGQGRSRGGSTGLDTCSCRRRRAGGTLISIPSGLNETVTEKAKAKGVNSYFFLVASNGDNMQTLADWLEKGIIRSYVSAVFDFTQMGPAHTRVESGRTRGKIIVAV